MRLSALSLVIGVTVSNSVYSHQDMSESKHPKIIDKLHASMQKITLQANQNENVGVAIYSEEKLKGFPSGNKTISDILQLNPNVQFSQNSQTAGKQGEISAADFSMNGAAFYENNILLDNVSLNNRLNPAAGSLEFNSTNLSGASTSNSINIDLLCELEVLDSNISAKYGDFTGGVVKAKTCAPQTAQGQLHGNVRYDYTSSDWTSLSQIDESEIDEYENLSSSPFQKEFKKQGISTSLYGNLTQDLGFNLSLSKRQSEIQLPTLLNNTQFAQRNLENQQILFNVYQKVNDQHHVKLGLQYADDQKYLESSNVLNGGTNQGEKNQAIELELKSEFDIAKITQSLVYQKQKQYKNFDELNMYTWRSSPDKNWSSLNTVTEGGYANLKQQLNNVEYSFTTEFIPFEFLSYQHQIDFGLGYGHSEAAWQRLNNSYQYFVPSQYGTNCIKNNAELDFACDASYINAQGQQTGQYHSTRVGYHVGEINVRNDRASLFFEDEISLSSKLQARLGVRAEYDSLNSKLNMSPRSLLQYKPFDNDFFKVTTGWNRYYINPLFAYALSDGINQYSIKETRKSINDEWGNPTAYLSSNVARSQLNSPFSDESMLALSSQWGGFYTELKYVDRDFKDQIKRNRISFSPIVDEYDNSGKMTANTYTLSISNLEPYDFLSNQHRFQLGIDYTKKKSNFNDYSDTYNPLTYQQYIIYNDQIIDEANRPASNFNRPWTARLSWDMTFDHMPLKISHFFKIRSHYDAMVASTIPNDDRVEGPDGNLIKTRYDATRIGSAFSWDMRTSYDLKLFKEQNLNFGLTIKNVTNKINAYTSSNSNVRLPEAGRQFIADINFTF